jgi:thiol:disulfide interchange protein DsbD
MRALVIMGLSFWMLISTSLQSVAAAPTTPLPAQQAFQFSYNVTSPEQLTIQFDMPPGYFLYQDKIKILTPHNSQLQIGTMTYPKAQKKKDASGQVHFVYFKHLSLAVPVSNLNRSNDRILEVQFQGCSDEGFCYPPQKRNLTLVLPENSEFSWLHQSSWWMIFLSFYGIGLLLAFTPCVLPMIPVLSTLILRQGEHLQTKKAFALTLAYVLGLSTAYALIGLCFALLGQNLQVLFQSIWMHACLAFLFFILALGMLDVYDIRPPERWQSWFQTLSSQRQSHAYVSCALLGALSVLVLSPCVTPPLVGVLAYITQTGNLFLGSSALFVLGLGSGTPLLLMSTSATYLLPKTGHWMNAVKNTFGILLLAVAIQLISADVPASSIMALWGCLLVTAGIFIGAFTQGFNPIEKIKQASGMITLLYGGLLIVGASMGNSNLLLPLAKAQSQETSCMADNPEVTYRSQSKLYKVKTLQELNQVFAQLKHQALLLDFYADWCAECRYLETHVWDKMSLNDLNHLTKVTIDLTPNDTSSKQLMKRYHIIAPPTFVVLNGQHQEVTQLRRVGAISQDEILKLNAYFEPHSS